VKKPGNPTTKAMLFQKSWNIDNDKHFHSVMIVLKRLILKDEEGVITEKFACSITLGSSETGYTLL
jgi:hypothetical protein